MSTRQKVEAIGLVLVVLLALYVIFGCYSAFDGYMNQIQYNDSFEATEGFTDVIKQCVIPSWVYWIKDLPPELAVILLASLFFFLRYYSAEEIMF
jgi:hypothetical protein